MKSLCYLLIFLSYTLSSQDYVDTIPKFRIKKLGVTSSNYLNNFDETKHALFTEHSLNFCYKYNRVFSAIGIGFTNQITVSSRYQKVNLIGITLALGFDLYNYKNRVIVPMHAHFNFYSYRFTEKGGIVQHFTLKAPGINSGIEYRPFKFDLFMYAYTGISYLTYRNDYREPNHGRRYIYISRSFTPTIELGLKYFFITKSKTLR